MHPLDVLVSVLVWVCERVICVSGQCVCAAGVCRLLWGCVHVLARRAECRRNHSNHHRTVCLRWQVTGQQDAVRRVWAPVVCWLWRCCAALSAWHC